MTFGQVLAVGVLALFGIALIVFGGFAWRRPHLLEGIRQVLTGLAPASIITGLVFLLMAANSVLGILSNYEVTLQRWWFLPPGQGALDGFLGSPIMALFIVGGFVLFWWPRDPQSIPQFFARLRNPATRAGQIWSVSRYVVTFAAGALVAVLGIAFRVNALLTILLLWVAGMAAWWVFARVVRRPIAPPELENGGSTTSPPHRPRTE